MGAGVSTHRKNQISPCAGAGHYEEWRQNKPWAVLDNKLSGGVLFILKERIQCICEGGRKCSRESPEAQKTPNAICGLHSSWVTGDVIAMARPWEENIWKHNVVDAFTRNKIGLVLNLQEIGEHAHCGPGILCHTGFSYDPETFMHAGIHVCSMAWRDMGVPSILRILDIVKVMSYTGISQQHRIAVHCHAGLGRTGLAISCYLVFAKGYDAKDAIQLVREGRPGALQTREQVAFVKWFDKYVKHARCVFGLYHSMKISSPLGSASTQRARGRSASSQKDNKDVDNTDTQVELRAAFSRRGRIGTLSFKDPLLVKLPTTMSEALLKQRTLLHGEEYHKFLHVHKVVWELCAAIVVHAHNFNSRIAHSSSTLHEETIKTNLDFEQSDVNCNTQESTRPQESNFADAFAQFLQVRYAHPKDDHPPDFQIAMDQFTGRNPIVSGDTVPLLKHTVDSAQWSQLGSFPPSALVVALESFLESFPSPWLCERSLSAIDQLKTRLLHPDRLSPDSNQSFADLSDDYVRIVQDVIVNMPIGTQHFLWVIVGMVRDILSFNRPGSQTKYDECIYQWVAASLLGFPASNDAVSATSISSLTLLVHCLCENDEVYATLLVPGEQSSRLSLRKPKV